MKRARIVQDRPRPRGHGNTGAKKEGRQGPARGPGSGKAAIRPFPYQAECLNELEWFGGRSLLALEPGLGKTLVALWWLKNHPEALPAVVVCPAAVKLMWEEQAHRILGGSVAVLSGRSAGRRGGKPRVAVVNYDVLRDWLPWVKAMKPTTVVIDESQYVGNSKAKRSRAVKELCRRVPNVLALSGTPLTNRPIELFTTLNILRPDEFPSRFRFAQTYCKPQLTPWGWNYKGASHSAELHARLTETCMVRRRKADVLKDLPPKLRSTVPMPLSDRGEYDRAADDFLAWLNEISPERARRAAKSEAMAKIGYLLTLAAKLKMPAVSEWIDEWLEENEGKLVVFCTHVEMIRGLRDGCRVGSVLIDGSVTGEGRRRAVEQFRNDNKTRVCFGNVRAAGTGVDGLQVASTVAFAELPWTPGAVTQAEDRCHRIGTKDVVWSWFLTAKGTIEDKLCRIIREKQEVLNAVLDGGMDDDDEADVFDLLMGELLE